MSTLDPADVGSVAAECVTLVSSNYGHQLDYSLNSLTTLDLVCHQLMADAPLNGQRLDLWYHLTGAYTGEVEPPHARSSAGASARRVQAGQPDRSVPGNRPRLLVALS